jgi:hypothetical protein
MHGDVDTPWANPWLPPPRLQLLYSRALRPSLFPFQIIGQSQPKDVAFEVLE